MVRFGIVALLLAVAAGAQTLSDPQPLTTATRTPSFRDTGDLIAARTRNGFIVVWKEGPVLRAKRLSPQGEITGESAMETHLGLAAMGANGDDALVSLSSDNGTKSFVHIHPDGRMTARTSESFAWSLIPFGDGYLGTSNDAVIRFDLDGRVLARYATQISGKPLVATDGGALLLSVDGNVLRAATIASDFTVSPDVVLSADVVWSAPVSASADHAGEIAIATMTSTGNAVLFFDSQLRSTGRVALPTPSTYHGPAIASSGDGYVILLPELGKITIMTMDARRQLANVGVVPNIWTPLPSPVSGDVGALITTITNAHPWRAQYLIAGGNEPPPPPRLLSDAEPEQRWPRIARIGDRVVIAWVESTGQTATLMAAIFDPYQRRIVVGPVEVAHDAVDEFGNELGIASNGSNIAIAWSAAVGGHLILLSPDLRTLVSGYSDHPHDVVWDGSDYLVASGQQKLVVERFDANLKNSGNYFAYGIDAGGFTVGYSDGRLSAGTSDALLIAHSWYHLSCVCGEGPWHMPMQRFSLFDGPFGMARALATQDLYDVKRKLSGFARVGASLLLFFPQKTEVRSNDTLALLATIPNDALTHELPYGSLGQAAVAGNEIVGTFGTVIEFFALDGTPISTLPLDESANDSQFVAGEPFVIVDDAVRSSGSRRINVRLLNVALPHRRAAGH